MYDLNTEFDVLDAAGLFINSSFGIGPDLGLSGPNGPSIFPATGLAVRLAAAPTEDTRIRLMVGDGTPGDPQNPERFRPAWGPQDGILFAGEVTRYFGNKAGTGGAARHLVGRLAPRGGPGKVAAGYWRYLGPADGSEGWGLYALAETHGSGPGGSELGLFGRVGMTRGATSPVSAYVGGGVSLLEVSPARPHDALGLGFAVAWARPEYLDGAGFDPGRTAPETVLETTYRIGIRDEVYLQPSIQWIGNPAGIPGASGAWLCTVRLGFTP